MACDSNAETNIYVQKPFVLAYTKSISQLVEASIANRDLKQEDTVMRTPRSLATYLFRLNYASLITDLFEE